MKAVLICPADRPGVARLAETVPLVLAPVLGKSVLEYWLESVVGRGATQVVVLASHQPHQVRTALGDGARWGLQVELIPENRELTIAEARAKYFPSAAEDGLKVEIALIDHLPGQPDLPLFENYAGWFAALQAWMPRALSPPRIGAREVHTGVRLGLRSQISPGARVAAPCWIGENVFIAPGASIGPGAIIEDRVIVERGARVVASAVNPDTFVGRHVSIENSLASGSTLINWQSGSCLDVPDAFLLGPLERKNSADHRPSLAAGVIAIATMVATAPLAVVAAILSILRGEAPLHIRLGVRAPDHRHVRSPQTFAYYELVCAGNWLRRWPQFWSVARGDLAWIGNRPLRPTQAFSLANDFERLWLATPPGLISLADASGCTEGVSAEACAHASYYSTCRSWRLDATILCRALLRAAVAWPLRWSRRREPASPLPQLVSKPQG